MDVSFLVRGDVWVNATEMAKGFGKKPYEWLRLPSTKEYIAALEEDFQTAGKSLTASYDGDKSSAGKSLTASYDLIRTEVGGSHSGTWMHEDVAIEFARWLSPKFSIACNRIIKMLFREGHIDIRPMLEMRRKVEELGHKRIAGITVNDSYSRLIPYMYEFTCSTDLLPPFTDETIPSKELRNDFKEFMKGKGINTDKAYFIEKFVRDDMGLPYCKLTGDRARYFLSV